MRDTLDELKHFRGRQFDPPNREAPLKQVDARLPGRWFITPHAAKRYIERVRHGVSYEVALGELIRMSEAAHLVRNQASGLELWRGPKPQRLRFLVSNEGAGKPQLVTVLFAFDRQ